MKLGNVRESIANLWNHLTPPQSLSSSQPEPKSLEKQEQERVIYIPSQGQARANWLREQHEKLASAQPLISDKKRKGREMGFTPAILRQVFNRPEFDERCKAALSSAKAMKIYLEEGGPLNTIDEEGNNMLHLAAAKGDEEMLGVMLEHFVTQNYVMQAFLLDNNNKAGQKPIDIARKFLPEDFASLFAPRT